MIKTKENLAAAFAGESQANRKYLAFAKAAEQQGQAGVAKLFRVAAEGEAVHANNHLRNMDGILDTKKNLQTAIEGETYEVEKMYPGFLEEAWQQGEEGATTSFERALAVEKVHQKMFQMALQEIEGGQTVEAAKFYVCPVCGFPSSPEAPEKCPVCGASKNVFYEVN